MKITNFIMSVAVASALLFGCKNSDSKSTAEDKETTSNNKKAAVALKPETASFNIEGMTCSIGCAKTIEKKLSKMNGVQNAKVDFDKKQATVEFDASILTPDKLVQAVESTGDGETYKVSNVKTNHKA